MKINLLLLTILLSVVAKAQITPGSVFIGGDLQLGGSSYKNTSGTAESENKHKNFYISPVLGYAVKENTIVGGRLIASFLKNSYTGQYSSDKGRSFGAGFFVRKYLPLGKAFYLFGDASLNGQYNSREQENEVTQSYSDENGFNVALSLYPGIAYQVKKSLFLEASLNNLVSINYGHNKIEQRSGTTITTIKNNTYQLSSSVGNSNPLQVGIRWVIPKK